MSKWHDLAGIRREYGEVGVDVSSVNANPVVQFQLWFEEALKVERADPTAMVLSTVDTQGYPDSRVVLLKGIHEEAFLFYTNYQSRKGQQMAQTPYAALNFYWPEMARQIRLRGPVTKVDAAQSDAYFAQRPVLSQISAIASPQSQSIASRAELEQRFESLAAEHAQGGIARPPYWGGYQIVPEEFEFWQGRDSRLHDRVHYLKSHAGWVCRRLAP
ncbi:MAG: pyridoxamine 5'-phosphate oxidase [Legionellaceae bacterium]|nr:pyridoxamine 5'-phosphate oxidase [Legionellaceae bacterium]